MVEMASESDALGLSVIVPTFNERDNVDALVAALERVLNRPRWEVVFVDDDSPDGTAEYVRSIARLKPHVRCIQRIGRRGLSSAVIEGILSSAAPIVAVMDGDLQHDESLLPRMHAVLTEGNVDVVVGSRYVEGGGVGDWDRRRARMSWLATRLSRFVIRTPLRDPMSGFFMLHRNVFDSTMRRLSGTGYKILLDLLASAPKALRCHELPYEFRSRHAGISKVESVVLWEYLLLLIEKAFGGRLPARFLSFALVGLAGLFVHFAVLASSLRLLGLPFGAAQATATLVAMTTNFLMNNVLTYSDRRLSGLQLLRGLVSFYVICALGAIANVGVANFAFARRGSWWLAGLAGVAVGTVWNYGMSALFTWGAGRRSR